MNRFVFRIACILLSYNTLAQGVDNEKGYNGSIFKDIKTSVGVYQSGLDFRGVYDVGNPNLVFGYHLSTSIHPFSELQYLGLRTGLSHYHNTNSGQFEMYSFPMLVTFRTLYLGKKRGYESVFQMLYSFVSSVVLAPFAPFFLDQYPDVEVYMGPTVGYYRLRRSGLRDNNTLFYQIEFGISIEARYEWVGLHFDFMRQGRSLFGIAQRYAPKHIGIAAGVSIFLD